MVTRRILAAIVAVLALTSVHPAAATQAKRPVPPDAVRVECWEDGSCRVWIGKTWAGVCVRPDWGCSPE